MTSNIELFLKISDQPLELFKAIEELWFAERDKEDKTYPSIVVDLHKKAKLNFYDIAVQAIGNGFNSFTAVEILCESAPDIEINVKSIVDFSEFLNRNMVGDVFAGHQFKIIEKLIEAKPELTRTFLDEFINREKYFIVGNISQLYQILAKDNEHEIHAELLTSIDNESLFVKIAVIDALGLLDYKPKENKILLNRTLQAYEKVEKYDIEEINRILVYAYHHLLKFSVKKPKDKLVFLSQKNQPSVKGALAHILHSINTEHYREAWFSEIILSLSDVPPEHKAILDLIDFVLSFLIEKQRDTELAEQFITAWVLNSSDYRKIEKIPDLFKTTFHKLVGDRKLLSNWVTKFFNSDHLQMNQVSAEILGYCIVHKIPPFPLDKEYLKTLDFDDCVYICRRILGYTYQIDYLCTLCFSMLDKSPNNKNIKGLVYNVMGAHVGEEFSHRTLEFLKTAINQTKSKNKIEIAKLLIRDLEKSQKQRSNLSELQELYPSSRKAGILARESGKKMSIAMKEAEKHSVFLSIATRIQLKHGTGSFHFMNGDYSDFSKLAQFSESYEIPRSEISHHVDAAIQRFNLRRVKRGEQ